MCVRFSPTGRAWAAASTEGLLLYGLDDTTTFDPFDLDIDITPESLLETIEDGDHLLALIMAFRLNEQPLILRAYESVPPTDIKLIARQVPEVYLLTLLRFIASHMENSPHVEFDLLWSQALMTAHGRYLGSRSSEFASVFRSLQRSVSEFEQNIAKL
jgi:periodic tryptophan protein 2